MRSDCSWSRCKSSTSSPPSSSLLKHQRDDTRRTETSSPEQQAAASTQLSYSSISFDPFHESSLDRTSTCRALAIDCTRGKPVVVSGSASGEVTIQWPLQSRAKIPPILLPMGHSQSISAVALWVSPCFPQSEDAIAVAADEEEEPPALICSASKDLLTLSQLNESLTGIVATMWEFAPSRVYRCISFDPSGYLLCLGVGKTVIVLRARKGSTLARLEGHTGSILAVRFDPQHPHICVSGSEDGTFKIWDLRAKACVYDCRTHIDPLVCLAFHPTNGILCTASSSGHLHLYRPTSSAAAAEAVGSRSGEMMEIASLTVPTQATYSADQASITSATVLDISFHHIPSSSATGRPSSSSSSSKEDLLIIATSDGILLADCRSRKVVSFASFSQGPFALACLDPEGHWVVYGEALSASCILHGPLNRLTMSESTATDRCGDGHSTSGGTEGSSPPSLEDAQNCHRDDEEEGYREGDGSDGDDSLDTMLGGRRRSRGSTSFFPSPAQEIPEDSPLKKDFFNRVTSASKKGLAYDDYTLPPKSKSSDGGAGKKQLPHDKPVVFHSRIRSSGYGSSPSSFASSRGSSKSKQTGVRPAAPAASAAGSGGLSAAAAAAVKGRRSKARNSPRPLSKQYPIDCGPLIRHQEANDLPTSSSASPLLHVAYGGDAQMFAAAALDGTVHLYRLPIAKHKGDGCTLVGHSLAVRHVSPSHDQTMVLTASDDGTSRLWALGLSRKSPAVTIKAPPAVEGGSSSPSNSSPSATTNSSSSSSSIGLPPIPKASFFYLDKFALVASGRSLYLYQYQIDLLSKDALIRHQASPGKARIIHTWTHTNAQKITSFDCLNGVLSPYIVTACSNRSLSILDAAYGSIVRTLHEAHARPIHTVTLPRPSAYCALPSSASLDVFATAATDNVITVWDLRANMARAASFRDHLNRRETLGVALSPCMRYLATGSEDRAAYLYDLRNGRVVHRLQGHEDVVSSVSFNPLHPQLATASYDGTLKFYTERDDGSGVC